MESVIKWLQGVRMKSHLTVAMIIRFLLIAYGQHQDENMDVKYTDIDYTVFTDAARHLHYGGSPYDRATYRYSPIIAYLMVPNIVLNPAMGKLIFVLFDLLAGYLIYKIVSEDKACREPQARISSIIWLYNPVVINISTRGSAESVIIAVVLLTLYFYQQKLFVLSGMMYGLAIHLKLYPVIYCLALYSPLTSWSGLWSLFQPSKPRVRLVLSTVFTLVFLTVIFYQTYGEAFLQEAYLYHFTRKDIRHNFSVYFYMLYLTVEYDDVGLNLITFLPQIIIILALAYRFCNIYDVVFCLFCQTVIFVTFNKVVTAQYFIWYFALLPLVAPVLNPTKKEILYGSILWGFAQVSWLLPAYLLEFRGINTFLFIWIESLAFFSANVGILAKMVRRYREIYTRIETQCDIHKLD